LQFAHSISIKFTFPNNFLSCFLFNLSCFESRKSNYSSRFKTLPYAINYCIVVVDHYYWRIWRWSWSREISMLGAYYNHSNYVVNNPLRSQPRTIYALLAVSFNVHTTDVHSHCIPTHAMHRTSFIIHRSQSQTWFTSYITVSLFIILIDFSRTINQLKARD